MPTEVSVCRVPAKRTVPALRRDRLAASLRAAPDQVRGFAGDFPRAKRGKAEWPSAGQAAPAQGRRASAEPPESEIKRCA